MKTLIVSLLLACFLSSYAQDYSVLTTARLELNNVLAISDTASRRHALDKWWNDLREAKHIPLVAEDSVLFLYRGEAGSVVWMGDFNGWGYNKAFENNGKRIPGTDVWKLRCVFPKDARLDYKIFINQTTWVLDHENPHHQWSGVGGGSPNSELRMPLWIEDPIQHVRPSGAHGTVKKDILFASKILGYQIMYNVYLPASHENHTKLPVIYVTDGFEYMLPELGNMITVLDNLIADKKIKPIIAVFLDQREPINRSNNKRMEELGMNEKYLKFFTEEFIPAVEVKYPILRNVADRAILGSSMGGLTSAYFAFARPDLFGMAGMQSPAFWMRPQIYALCDKASGPKLKVSLTSGLINDASEGSRKMRDILQNNSCVYHYRENNEGHSWGNWRNLIDDILIDFFGRE